MNEKLRIIESQINEGAELIGAYLLIDGAYFLVDRFKRKIRQDPPGNLAKVNLTNPVLVDGDYYAIKDVRGIRHDAKYEAEAHGGYGKFHLNSGQFFYAETITDWRRTDDR